MPGSQTRKLAEYFDTRDSGKVVEGIGKVLAYQADRLEDAIEAERQKTQKAIDANEPIPEPSARVDKLLNDIQKNGRVYAILLDPGLLRATPGGEPSPPDTPALPQKRHEPSQIEISEAIRALESRGYRRDGVGDLKITPHLILQELGLAGEQPVLEAELVEGIPGDF